ncbi:MAG: Gx transporter family protein [Bacilli bacterium]|jgi:heptaprenyl diphosphate synthase|nr:Gx transporter family protein [Bacilli bacterium]
MRHWSTKKMVIFALFLAIGVVLNYAENVLIAIPVIPGIKLGIANTLGLLVLAYFGPAEFILLGFLRVLLTSLFSGIGVATIISFAGWLLSSAVVVGLYFTRQLSIFGLSLISAVMHGLGQIVVVSIIYETWGMFAYFPILAISGIISGTLIAFLSRMIILRLPLKESMLK